MEIGFDIAELNCKSPIDIRVLPIVRETVSSKEKIILVAYLLIL